MTCCYVWRVFPQCYVMSASASLNAMYSTTLTKRQPIIHTDSVNHQVSEVGHTLVKTIIVSQFFQTVSWKINTYLSQPQCNEYNCNLFHKFILTSSHKTAKYGENTILHWHSQSQRIPAAISHSIIVCTKLSIAFPKMTWCACVQYGWRSEETGAET